MALDGCRKSSNNKLMRFSRIVHRRITSIALAAREAVITIETVVRVWEIVRTRRAYSRLIGVNRLLLLVQQLLGNRGGARGEISRGLFEIKWRIKFHRNSHLRPSAYREVVINVVVGGRWADAVVVLQKVLQQGRGPFQDFRASVFNGFRYYFRVFYINLRLLKSTKKQPGKWERC